MVDFIITFARSARKELERLSIHDVMRILPKIEALVSQPGPEGCRKLTGEHNLWRIRVGDYRVVYMIDDEATKVEILVVRHRSDAYR